MEWVKYNTLFYKFNDEKKLDKFMFSIKDKLVKAGKTTKDQVFFFKTYFEKLGNFKSDFELNFHCEAAKKKF